MNRLLLAIAFLLAWPAPASALNQPPVVDAGPDKPAYTAVWAALDGAATDPDGDPILSWTCWTSEMHWAITSS